MNTCRDIPNFSENFDSLFFTKNMYEITYSLILLATCLIVLIKMDLFRKRTEQWSSFITLVMVTTAVSNLISGILIMCKWQAATSWLVYFLDLTAGSKQLAFWTFAAQYALVAVILPQLFPKVMLPFTLQDFVDKLIQ